MNTRQGRHLYPVTGILILFTLSFAGCATAPTATTSPEALDSATLAAMDPDNLGVVDCLLPGRIRRLGTRIVTAGPRRPVRTLASICEIRGGEYVAFDRANFDTALRFWLPQAEEGDPRAQTFVGEIHERGLGRAPDPSEAARWYRLAADQGFERAQLRLGRLYEEGRGVPRDLRQALGLYRGATGQRLVTAESLEEAQAQLGQIRQALNRSQQQLQQTRAARVRTESQLREALARNRSAPAAPTPTGTPPPADEQVAERSLRELSDDLIVLTDQEEVQEVQQASLSSLASIAAGGW